MPLQKYEERHARDRVFSASVSSALKLLTFLWTIAVQRYVMFLLFKYTPVPKERTAL